MGYRVNKITVTLELFVEFQGSHETTFCYTPDADDPLVVLAVAKNDALLYAAAKAAGPMQGGML